VCGAGAGRSRGPLARSARAIAAASSPAASARRSNAAPITSRSVSRPARANSAHAASKIATISAGILITPPISTLCSCNRSFHLVPSRSLRSVRTRPSLTRSRCRQSRRCCRSCRSRPCCKAECQRSAKQDHQPVHHVHARLQVLNETGSLAASSRGRSGVASRPELR